MHNAIGIDIGGTRIKAVGMTAQGDVRCRGDEPTADHREALIAAVIALIDRLGDAPACGIAAPGIAAADGSRISWMRGRLESIQDLIWSAPLGRKVSVINDAQAATLAESWIGAARGRRHVVMLTLGTGVGGGVICDGRPLIGATGRAGHLGHLCMDAEGPRDIVGTPGSLEDMVGECTLARRSGGLFTSTEQLLRAVASGDRFARELWERTIRALACGLVSLINAFDPEVIVLGGGVANSGECLFGPLHDAMQDIEWRPDGRGVPIVPAALGETAGAIGAARWALLSAERSDGRESTC